MKAIVVMFDSMNRNFLEPYGADWTHTPNFRRLAERTVTFDRCYAGSLPCMPARRELHTGRHNFLHRSWGPLEPFDDSMPEMLKEQGIYTHLVTDHQHYFEDGGGTYHTRYNTWEFFRGQEGDAWKGRVGEVDGIPAGDKPAKRRQDRINRDHLVTEADHPQTRTFDAGLEFIDANKGEDGWFLQIETFDPHEPFFSHKPYKDLYPHHYDGPEFDWPAYAPVSEPADQVTHARYEYAALLSMCDESLGRVLDMMDENEMWDDTLLIVCTDHGYLLGENGWWAKAVMPWYDPLVHTPLFVWDPRSGVCGERRSSLVQTIDIAPTVLDWFGIESTPDMQGAPLAGTVERDEPVRAAGLFGSFGAHVNVTDGRYVYMRAPDDNAEEHPLHEYTLMPTRMRGRFSVDDLSAVELAEPFSFTKGLRTMRVPASMHPACRFGTLLFDLEVDPRQQVPISDPETEHRMLELLHDLLVRSDAPTAQFDRLGLPRRREELDHSPQWLRAHIGRDRAGRDRSEFSGERLVADTLAQLAPSARDDTWLHRSVHALLQDPVMAPVMQRHAPNAFRDELLTVGGDISLVELATAHPDLIDLDTLRTILDGLHANAT